jgi:tetratricopeptide (TPR) repeat protein
MESNSSVFDVFQSVKNLLYLGNYSAACEEANNTDINEEDVSQIVKRYFYIFISCIEEQKTEELNNFLGMLKESKSDQIKIYYNLFLFYSIYIYKKQFNEQKFNKLYTDLKNVKKYDPVLIPAVYILSLMCLDRGENENFLQLIEKFEQDIEILLLKFYMFFNLNKSEEMEKVINTLSMKEPDSIITLICQILFSLYTKNDFDFAINSLQQINKNNKLTVKLFNFIGVSLMSKGQFYEAIKALNVGKENAEKNGIASNDYFTVLVNLICCYRNVANEEEIRNCEELLRKTDPKNIYFNRLANFEDEFVKATSG